MLVAYIDMWKIDGISPPFDERAREAGFEFEDIYISSATDTYKLLNVTMVPATYPDWIYTREEVIEYEDLKGLDTAKVKEAYVLEGDRKGQFIWMSRYFSGDVYINHSCEHPGCTAYGSSSYDIGSGETKWFCHEHP